MYAEIKSTNQILINRLDENEKLLLKDIVEKAKNSKVELKELLDETGDFGGVMIELTEVQSTAN